MTRASETGQSTHPRSIGRARADAHPNTGTAGATMTADQSDDADACSRFTGPTVELAAPLERYRQGDLLATVDAIAVTGDDGHPTTYPTPGGVVLISQTCDIVQITRAAVAVAPAVELDSDTAAAEARNGKRPSLVHLPELGANTFANLEIVGTISKHHLVRHEPAHGVSTDGDIRRLGQLIGRKWSRFAFPDDIVPWLEPLRTVLASKALKPTSPEGHALESVIELRVEAHPGWSKPGPQELTLVIIVAPGTMPYFDEAAMPDLPDELGRWLYDDDATLIRTSADLAARLTGSNDPVEQYFLWDALGQAWTAKCTPDGKQPASVRNAVANIVSEVLAADEYTLDRAHSSEQLDLDHLSEPLPRPPSRPSPAGGPGTA